MASTYSTNLALELIGTGDLSGTWGVATNNNLGTLLEQAISGYATQAVATGTDTTITIPDGTTGVARNMFIELTGTGGASTNLLVPAKKKLYLIYNNTAGQVTVKVSGQTGVSVPAAAKIFLVSNGTDIVNALSYFAALSVGTLAASGAITGNAPAGANIISHSSGYGLQVTAADAVNQFRLTRTGSSTADFRNYVSGNSWVVADLSGTGGNMSLTSAGVLSLSAPLPLASGGTGASSVTAYAVVTGNSGGTGFSSVAPSTNGNVLTSNGTAWTSAALAVPSAASTAVTQTGASTTTYVTPAGLLGAIGFSADFVSSDQTITAAGALTIAHGLGRAPLFVQMALICQSSELGYTTGMVVPYPVGQRSTSSFDTYGAAVVTDSTNLSVRYGSISVVFSIMNFSTGDGANIDPTKWKVRFYAFG